MTPHFVIKSIKDTLDNSASKIAKLYHQSYAAGQALAGNPDTFEYDDPDTEGWEKDISKLGDNRHIRAIFNDKGGIVAFSHFGTKDNDPEAAELYNLYVSPKHWGKGFGTALFNDAVDILQEKGCKTLLIEVGDDEPHPMQFYKNRNCYYYKSNSDGGEILTHTLKYDLANT